MGVSTIARWPNAPTNALELVRQNIIQNHGGLDKGKWSVSVKSFRAVSDPDGIKLDRSLCYVTMGGRTFAILDDQAAPQLADFKALQEHWQAQPLSSPTGTGRTKPLTTLPQPAHYRTTMVTTEPVGALESLLSQLGPRWASTRRQNTNIRNQPASSGNQLVIEGNVFSIGSDWIVRIGNVQLAGGAMKGMLLEAEYLPLPTMHSNPGGTPILLINMLSAVLPAVEDAAYAEDVIVDDVQWAEIHWNVSEASKSTTDATQADDDVFAYESEEDPSLRQLGDWTGIDRDRRSAFLIVGTLRPEGMLSM